MKDDKRLFTKCWQYALSYINRYPKAEKELKAKLLQKWYSLRDTDNTIDALKEQNFVNDERFTESYINSEICKKGKPPIAVFQKLYQKGIDKQLIKDKFTEMEEDIQNGIKEKILKEVQKHKQKAEQKWEDINPMDIIQKISRKGYKIDDVIKALKE